MQTRAPGRGVGYPLPAMNRTRKLFVAVVGLAAALGGIARAQQELPKTVDLGGGKDTPFLPADFVPAADGAYADYSRAWPERVVREDLAGRRGTIVGIEPGPGRRVIRFSAHRVRGSTPADSGALDDARTLLGEYQKSMSLKLEGPGSMLVDFETAGPEEKKAREDRASFYFKFVSARDVTPKGMPRKTVELQRTWFAFYDAVKSNQNGEKPVVLIIPGMFGTPEPVMNGLVNRLRLRGWPVLRMIVHPSRFTETRSVVVDAEKFEDGVEQIADVLTQRAVDCAYAAQAGFEYVGEMRPELKDRQRVAIGCSGGAMAMPTVVALEPERYQSMVLVGGGADFFLISERSNYASWIDALRVSFSGEISAEQRRAIDRTYLEKATLDAYHTAAAWKGKRALLIQGSIDRAVPSDLGDLLWERLGRPDRWLDAQTHETLFMTLPMRYDAIIEWLAGKPAAQPADTQAADSQPGKSHP